MFDFFISTIVYILEFITDSFLIATFTETSLKRIGKRFFPCLLINLAISMSLGYYLPEVLSWLVGIIITIVIYYFLFKQSWNSIFIAYMIAYLSTAIAELVLIIPLSPFGEFIMSWQGHITGKILTMILLIFVCKFTPYKVVYQKIISGNIYTKITLSDVFVIFLSVIALSKISIDLYMNLLPILILLVLMMLFTNLNVIQQQSTIEKQHQELSAYNEYQPVVNELIQQVRNKQHDFDNQLTAIKMLPITYKDYPSLSDALNNYSYQITQSIQESALLKLNLKLVAGFIFSQMQKASSQDKKLNVTIRKSILRSVVPEYEIVKVIGILTDNCIEAIESTDMASLILDCEDNRIIIQTTNIGPVLTENLRNSLFQRGYTTKEPSLHQSKHGIGLHNLLEICKRYDGEIDLYNGTFEGNTTINFIIRL